jgi:uncharacterized protein
MDPLNLIEAHAGELRALGARKIGVFESFARGDQTPESDVDVYLEFAEGMKTYDNFFATHELLQEIFADPSTS